ncbi:MAG: thioredoxin domain-containing protein [Verrucomicrobiales bacterium]|nr:thioredoxin domain-containing protein [Verrucomicrobiales bacterium]
MHTNRLAREKSPYLLQHAHNPVDWFAWNDEAFARARAENKPVFLSIGYSTCHWCHVMERESFEQENIGKFLNEHFVSIKVDREERPDVDKIYMTFVQSTTGSGGWPMSVFLTPDLKPFFGGTYFPPDARHGRPGFLQLLQQISQLWRERREELASSAEEIHARLEIAMAGSTTGDALLDAETIRRAGALFKESYDPRHGGFGGAPKFPQPGIPSLVLRYARRFNDVEAVKMVLHTCDAMAAGGIHDQLGGGFARYSVDAEWLVPHFEKMLYDNAQLAQLYLDAFLVSGDERHAEVVRDILDYVLRDMTHPDGGFYSAEDADSEGQEGKFYCWTKDELSKLLTVEEFNVAAKYFGITAAGNFIDHSHPQPLQGLNVLSVVNPVRSSGRESAQTSSQSAERIEPIHIGCCDDELLASAKKKMLAVRAQRVRPHLDDKILASWNGLMIGAFARAYAVIGDETYRAAAEKNLAFICEKLWVNGRDSGLDISLSLTPGERENHSPSLGKSTAESGSATDENLSNAQRLFPLPGGEDQGEGRHFVVGTLFHRWRDGERDSVQLLEAYAFLLSGVIDLYEATLEPKHLDFAIELAGAMLVKFYDAENGGFWQSAAGATDLILRVKDDYDGAEPSGNSVATLALLKLGAITGRKNFTVAAEKTLRLFAHRLQNFPQALPFMLHAVDFSLQEPARVVVAGDPGLFHFDLTGDDTISSKALALLHAAHSVYRPNKIVLGSTGAVEEFARTLPAKDGAVVYLCTGNVCQPPTDDPAKLKEMLK